MLTPPPSALPARASFGRTFFPFLYWPLWNFREVPPQGLPTDLRASLQKGRFTLRLLRYWWVIELLREQERRMGRPLVVVDLGCGRGWLRRLAEGRVNARWIGLDGHLDTTVVGDAGYDRFAQADFHERLPLETAEADVVVSLHVFEHLQRPDAAMSEVRRVLRPEGLFLAGTPTMPAPLAVLGTAWHPFRHAIGRPGWNGHVRSFSPLTWQRLLQRHGFEVRFMTGSHWVRLSGSHLESSRGWVRANQFLGALFPSLGSEVYLSAERLPNAPQRSSSARGLWAGCDWAVPSATLAVILALGLSGSRGQVESWLKDHRDSDDVYVLCDQGEDLRTLSLGFPEVAGPRCDRLVHRQQQNPAADHHIVVEWEDAQRWLGAGAEGSWRVVDQLESGIGRLALLSEREPGLVLSQVRWPESGP